MFDIKEELRKLPQKPGVYIMKDVKDNVIYVGKAINLKNRVSQYFQNSKNHPLKVKKMVPNIKEFEYIVTGSEMEALILECNLIKEHKPKYNILLKDDKQYPYVKITNEDFPRVILTRKRIKDKAKYYGPYTTITPVKEVLDLVHQIWPIRRCQKALVANKCNERPCLNYHIGQCKAPCAGYISEEEYMVYINKVLDLMNGKYESLITPMKEEMHKASEELMFERAAQLRDQINAIKGMSERQSINNSSLEDQDVIAFAQTEKEALVQVFFVRSGKLLGREHFMLENVEHMNKKEIMTEFVKQFYSGTPFIPKEILLQEEIDEMEMIQTWLSSIRENKVQIIIPQKGEKNKIVELAAQNAEITLDKFGEKIRTEIKQTTGAMEEIAKALGIEEKITRVEAYDISNIQGFESVASMIVFEDGKPKRSDYRKFKIKSVFGPDDYASMEEVLTRRFLHAIKETEQLKQDNQDISQGKFTRLPDIIFMDGGKGQVNVAKKVMSDMGMSICICGMVKDDKHRTRGLIYNDEEVILPYTSEGFKLITRIQDEVHRFAIEYHRSLRTTKQLHSVLDEIDGIGSARRKALLLELGSVERIKEASLEELLEVKGVNEKAARSVYNFFHGNQ